MAESSSNSTLEDLLKKFSDRLDNLEADQQQFRNSMAGTRSVDLEPQAMPSSPGLGPPTYHAVPPPAQSQGQVQQSSPSNQASAGSSKNELEGWFAEWIKKQPPITTIPSTQHRPYPPEIEAEELKNSTLSALGFSAVACWFADRFEELRRVTELHQARKEARQRRRRGRRGKLLRI